MVVVIIGVVVVVVYVVVGVVQLGLKLNTKVIPIVEMLLLLVFFSCDEQLKK